MSLASRFLVAAVLFALAMPQSVWAQEAMNPIPFGTARRVDVQLQIVDVTADEFAKAQQKAHALQPALPADMDAQLKTGLSGLGVVWLRYEFAQDGISATQYGAPMVTQDNLPSMFVTYHTTIVPNGGTVTTSTFTSIKPHIRSDGRVSVELAWNIFDPDPKKRPQVFTVNCTAPDGQLTVVAVPMQPGQPQHLVFLTATVEPVAPSALSAPGFNVYPHAGTNPNGMDKMQVHPPDVRDPMNVLPPPSVKPVINLGGK